MERIEGILDDMSVQFKEKVKRDRELYKNFTVLEPLLREIITSDADNKTNKRKKASKVYILTSETYEGGATSKCHTILYASTNIKNIHAVFNEMKMKAMETVDADTAGEHVKVDEDNVFSYELYNWHYNYMILEMDLDKLYDVATAPYIGLTACE